MKERVATSLVLAPLILGVFLCNSPYPMFLLCIVATTIAFGEIRRMMGSAPALPVVTLVSVALPVYANLTGQRASAQLLPWAILLFVVGLASAFAGARSRKAISAQMDLGGLWASIPLLCVFLLHRDGSFGHGLWRMQNPALMALLPIWAGDIAAIIVGKQLGRHPLMPKISPKKTVEGSVANFLACLMVAYPLGLWIGLPGAAAAVCGIAAGTLGQFGDLFESAIKRFAGLKDSGNLLPGHGGLMDRIDSILFAAPAIALTVILWPR